MNPAPEAPPRHAALVNPHGEPTDGSPWAAAYSDGADRARRAQARMRPETKVDRRGRRRRRERV
jgi:hypothetical protein